MKIERLSHDKIRIFLTFDDLTERGIQKEDIWREIPKVHELFSEMMEQANDEFGFEATGPLAVEVFQLPAQGMVVIVTRGSMEIGRSDSSDEEDEDVYEMEVTLEQSDLISYVFRDFEELLRLAKVIRPMLTDGGMLYNYKGNYVLQLDPSGLDESGTSYEAVIAVLSEFGEATSVTSAVLAEYGKLIIEENAVHVLCSHFQ